jgi:dephospho-CoA kinase
MIVVGLTGGIGSGKSTVSAALAEHGAVVVDADAITRRLQEPGQPVLAAMVERFGPGIIAPDGRLDRQAVADLVFPDPQAVADLNGIVHPAVGEEIARQLAAAAALPPETVVILDVPLLVESARGGTGATIVVDCDPEVAVRRLVEQRGFREDDARARIARQASREDRLARADFVIDNGGERSELGPQIERCWDWLRTLPPTPAATG